MKAQHAQICTRYCKHMFITSMLSLLFCGSSFAQTLNKNMMTTNGTVRTTIQDGNTIYLGGEFTQVGWAADHLARFKPGSDKPDNQFPQLGGGTGYDIELDGNGGYYITGETTYVNGVSVTSDVNHLMSDNTLDTAFQVITDGAVYTTSKLGSVLYLAGSFTTVNGEARSNVAAVDAVTGATLSWVADAPNAPVNLVEATDSTIFILGDFNYVGGYFIPGRFAGLDASTGHITFNTPVGDGVITTCLPDGDKLYVGGNFNEMGISVQGMAKLSTSSTTAAPDFPRTDGYVYTILKDGTGGWFMGGSFNYAGGEAHQNLAHVLADGTVDPNFNASTNTTVWCLATDGTNLFVGGDFTVLNGSTRNYAGAVLRSNGSLTTWDPNANGSVWSMAFSGSNVYMGGGFTMMKGTSRNYAAAVSSSGAGVLQTWSPSTNNYVFTIIPDGTGANFYLGGRFTTVKGATHNYIAKVNNTNGNVNSWNPIVNNEVWSLALNGTTLYMGGVFTQVGSAARSYFAAITEGATQPTSLQADANSAVNSISVSGSHLYLCGYFTQLQGVDANYLARVNLSTGLLDTTWKGKFNDAVSAVSIIGTTVVAVGIFSFSDQISRNHLACIELSTNQLTDWNPLPQFNFVTYINRIVHYGSEIFAAGAFGYFDNVIWNYHFIALNDSTGEISHLITQYPTQPVYTMDVYDGKVALGGAFTAFYDYNSETYSTRNYLAAYNLSDFQLAGIDYLANNGVYDLVSDGTNLIACGPFTLMGSVARSHIAAIDAVTGVVNSFNPYANANVNAIAVSGGTVYAGGEFTNIGGQNRSYLAALNATDGTATSWNADCNSHVWATTISGTTLYVGGYFTTIRSQSRNYAAAVSTTGNGSVTNWQPNPNNVVEDILPVGSDVYIAGYFTTVKGSARNFLAKVNNTNGNLNSWNPSPDSYCYTLASNATTLFAGGTFENISGQARSGVAAFDIATGNLSSFHPIILPAYTGLYDMAIWGNSLFMISGNGLSMNINGQDRGSVAAVDIATGNLLSYDPKPVAGGPWCIDAGNNRLLVSGAFGAAYGGTSVTPYFAVSTLSPLSQSSALTFSDVTPFSMQANFSNGSGERRIVVVKENSAVSKFPLDGQSYSASAVFKGGSNLGNGSYVVYDGTGSSVNVTNLLPNHTYYFAVMEYNGSSDFTAYLSPALTGSQATPCNTFTPVITPDGSTTFCTGGVTLSAPAGFASYLWSNGATTQSIFVTTSGNFSVTVTDDNSCTGTSTPVTVTASAGPVSVITPAGATTFCDGGKVKLNANTGEGLTYQWKRDAIDISGATKKNYTAKLGGSYTLLVTANGCSTLSSAEVVTVNPSPASKITNNSPVNICQGQSVVLTAKTGVGYTYKWQLNGTNIGGSTNSTYIATVAGSYTVKTTNPFGCSKTSQECIVTITCKDGSAVVPDANLLVYPNPSQGNFIVSCFADATPVLISLFDITGREVMAIDALTTAGKMEIPVDGESLPPGMYFIKVKSGGRTEVQKIEIIK